MALTLGDVVGFKEGIIDNDGTKVGRLAGAEDMDGIVLCV
jgi:hypothetical protein